MNLIVLVALNLLEDVIIFLEGYEVEGMDQRFEKILVCDLVISLEKMGSDIVEVLVKHLKV